MAAHAPTLPDRVAARIPPHAWFVVSAIFHYLGPSFAVLLFPSIGVLGVAWLRIGSAAAVFLPVAKPWRLIATSRARERWLLAALGVCLAAMNCSFYLALARLPISVVASIEFVGTIAIALYGVRTRRNLAALLLSVGGVYTLIGLRWSDDAVGLAWAFANGALFIVYILLGHRIARAGAAAGIQRLGTAMLIAFIAVLPVGFAQALTALRSPLLLAAGIGVGICSSVVPYVADQLAMARLPRASFALLLALLPASATVIGAIVLAQIPSGRDLVGLALVMAGVMLHRPAPQG